MDGRRTYLDSLNAGRQRRPQSTLDDLSKSLERLGERLDRRHDKPRQEPAPQFRQEPPQARLAEEIAYREPLRRPPADSAASMLREDNYAATTGKLAGEIKGLRDELRQQMTSGLQREFESLRKDIARAATAPANGKSTNELTSELERLSGSIQALSSRNDDKGVNLLRLDIEQIRGELDTLARQESMDSRWDQMDRRWSAMEHRMDARREPDAGLAALNDRLQEITQAVHSLPESLSLRSLEDKVRTLASAVDHFATLNGQRPPQFFDAVEQRLDEISRAIVASSAAAQPAAFDFEPIERIERRISALAEQLEDLSNAGASAEIIERLNTLSQRIDEVALRADLPVKSVEKLAGQIALIADHIDAGAGLSDANEIVRGLESRFDQFANDLERRQDIAVETSQAMFRDLENRLFDVVSKLEAPSAAAPDNSHLMDAIDARFDDFARRIEMRKAELLDRSAVSELEAKIDTISHRMDSAPPSSLSIDSDTIRSLESQVAGLSAYLAKPDTSSMDALSPRLDRMEKAIGTNRDLVIDAARRAAEDVVRTFKGSGNESIAVAGLAQDLKALETLTLRSDDRNAKTFEAIHDTLLKIVDRLGAMEGGKAEPIKMPIRQAPPIAMADDDADSANEPAFDTGFPADAGAAHEMTAMPDVAAMQETGGSLDQPLVPPAPEKRGRRSMLGGLGRALKGRKTAMPAAAPLTVATDANPNFPTLDPDEPLDPSVANRPLEPGSGAPDLSAIMRRVRDERQQQPAKSVEVDPAQSDFLAAARRNARAAAAEAQVLKKHSDIAAPGRGLKLGELLRSRRSAIMMGTAAVLIAVAGLQLGKAFIAQRGAASVSADMSSGGLQPAAMPAAIEITQAPKIANAPPETGAMAAAEQSAMASASPPAPAAQADDASVRNVDSMAATPGMAEDTSMAKDTGMGAPMAMTPDAPKAETPVAQPEVTASVLPPKEQAAQPEIAAPDLPKAPADAGPTSLREAADGGDPKAMFEIGARYSEGRGTKTDPAKAAEWYGRAADMGLAPAQYRIGNMYEKGIGVARDLKKAKTYYQMAAEQGNASAMHNLAVLYAMGADGTTDNDSAARWFIKAGELGVKDSQFNLGILAAKGVGMPQSLEESYKWFALVAKTGDRDAAAKRDEVANSLRPEQLERARAATELWKPKKIDPAANVVDIPDEWQESKEKTASIDMKRAVQTIQLILNKNGYDAGGADGVMGDKTKKAIVAFQKDNNLPADGEVTEKLVQELLARK